MLKNLSPRASSINPRVVLNVFNQSPLLGNLFSNDGKRANRVKGRANAVEKAAIVTMGVKKFPVTDLISTVPTIGEVHEKDTKTNVSAIKKIPPNPLYND